MCGICGYINADPSEKVQRDILKKMNDSITHRGPDDEGYFTSENVGFAMRRLSIIDLSGGIQPLFNEKKDVVCVFNGELYNFQEIKNNLIKKGHTFYTRTDGEILVHLYEEYKENLFHHLNGMFAIALWDNNTRTLLLARDRLGIKPLYYHHTLGGLFFGSELKAIIQHPKVKKELNYNALNKYLTFEYVPAPDSVFTGINKLFPGEYLLYRNGKTEKHIYWNPEIKKDDTLKTEDDYTERLLELLENSVKLRLISDVPLGGFLSGGIDSSTICAIMKKYSTGKVKTFTIGFKDKSFDESRYSQEVADFLDTEHYFKILDPNLMVELIPEIFRSLDEPFGDASVIPTYLLSGFTRENVTVALSGDGGDELFAGYPTYQAHKLARFYEKVPPILREKVFRKIIESLPVSMRNISFDFQLKKFVSGIPYLPEQRNYVWLGSFSPEEKQALINPDIASNFTSATCFDTLYHYLSQFNGSHLLEKILYLDLKFYLQDDMLVKVDRASMANSLEARVPFLDHNLVDFVHSIPWSLKLKGFTTKYILKKAVGNLIPSHIIKRKKKGFGIPVARWIRSDIKDLVFEIFDEKKIKREGIFNYGYISNLIENHLNKKQDNRKKLWTLIAFELWLSNYLNEH